MRSWLRGYGYRNVRTPVLEHTRLFARGIGEVTDIVEKEMYTFTDALNGESLTMRPEMTAGIVRASIEHNLLYDRPQRVYSIGPVFRHERPQRGRYRQFHQIDVEALGFAGPDVDAELIVMLARLWKLLGLTDVRLELNSLGQPAERAAHRAALIEHLEKHRDILDEDGQRRMYTNPLRVLDTKNPAMQEMADSAPRLFDFLGEESRAHFDGVCQRLADAGIEYRLNPRLVRGLDYYNLTVFEWVTDRLGSQGTVWRRPLRRPDRAAGRQAGAGCGLRHRHGTPAGPVGAERRGPGRARVRGIRGAPGRRGPAPGRAGRRGPARRRSVGDRARGRGQLQIPIQARRRQRRARVAVILGADEVAARTASVKFLRADAQGEAEQRQVALAELASVLKNKG